MPNVKTSGMELSYSLLSLSYKQADFNRDLKVIRKALKRQDLEGVNIQCNRIMSNSYLLNQDKFTLTSNLEVL